MHFVYHPHHEAVIVSTEEYQTYLDNGWYDTPAKFPNNIEAVVVKAPEEETKAEEVAVEIDTEVKVPEEEKPEEEKQEAAPKKAGRPPKAKLEKVDAPAQG